MPPDADIVLLCGPDASSNMVYHALAEEFGRVRVIQEQPGSRWRLAKARVKRLGMISVAGQMLFVLGVLPWLRRRSRERIRQLVADSGRRVDPIPEPFETTSVNSAATRELLQEWSPTVVVVNGTRIIGRKTLSCIDRPFVNTHAGVTPCYRGVHGGYWALAEGHLDQVGTTIHYVDRGIDTGQAIERRCFAVTHADDFSTYPTLHTLAGLPALVDVVRKILKGETVEPLAPARGPSRLRHHPTVWGYLWRRWTRGVR